MMNKESFFFFAGVLLGLISCSLRLFHHRLGQKMQTDWRLYSSVGLVSIRNVNLNKG